MLNPLIIEIGDIEIAARRHGEAAGRVELAGSAAAGSQAAPVDAVEAEDLDAVVPVIGDVEFTLSDGQIHRPPESVLAERALEPAVEIEHLDAAVAGVADEDLGTGDSDTRGIAELARPVSRSAPGHDESISGFHGRGNEGQPAPGQQDRQKKKNAAEDLEKLASHGYSIAG